VGASFETAILFAITVVVITCPDKTGTLTKSQPEVIDVVTDRLPEAELLSLAAAVERESEHPLAQAVVRRADGDSAAAGARQSASRPSLATARWRQWAAAGWLRANQRLMEREEVLLSALEARRQEPAAEGKTVVWVACGRPCGGPPRYRGRAPAPPLERWPRSARPALEW
jgi:P-type Cu2+ transporter